MLSIQKYPITDFCSFVFKTVFEGTSGAFWLHCCNRIFIQISLCKFSFVIEGALTIETAELVGDREHALAVLLNAIERQTMAAEGHVTLVE